MKNILILLSICLGFGSLTDAQGQAINSDELELKIDALVPKQVNDTTPGLVIGIVQNGELIFSKGYGLANLAYGIPNDPKMVYNIGSVSKQFLGYAFAMLHVKGDLNIDDPVTKYLEDWPEFEHVVTLRHLLTHTSGYREAYAMSNLAGRYIGTDRLSREECLNVVRKQPQLEFEPGSRWTYNSTTWVILAEVFEKIKGESAEDWVKSNMLDALGMKNTQIETYVGEVIANAAESYSVNDDQGYVNEKSNRAIFGAAEVYTSIEDMTNWINNFRSAEIGGNAVKDLFLDPFILKDGTNSGYALGIEIGTYHGLKRYMHTGGHEAFSTQLSYFPDQDLGIFTISNFGGRGRINTSAIADLLLEEHMTSTSNAETKGIKIKKNELKRFSGLYLASTLSNTIELTISDDTLMISGRTKLIPTSKNTFGINGWSGQIQINSLPNKNQLVVINGGKEYYTKVDKWVPDENDLKSFEGDYWSDELETVYHLKMKGDKLSIHHRWIGELSLDPIINDFFKTEWGFNVKFTRNTEGNISGLSIYSGRTLNVNFQRMNY
jgi:CubicO group peptidase (beta-lactamase class C family)